MTGECCHSSCLLPHHVKLSIGLTFFFPFRFPNLAVAVITRDSVRQAFRGGITASQITRFHFCLSLAVSDYNRSTHLGGSSSDHQCTVKAAFLSWNTTLDCRRIKSANDKIWTRGCRLRSVNATCRFTTPSPNYLSIPLTLNDQDYTIWETQL